MNRWPQTLQLVVPLLIVAALATAPANSQKKQRTPKFKIDPYTKNDPVLMKKAGYVSYGPFPFGEHGSKLVDTQYIEKHLDYAEILWVETAHFRICSTLEAYPIPNELETRRKIRAELEQLKKKLGKKVNPRARVLNRWLRLHLTAQRMENLYAELQSWLQVKDTDFPKNSKAKIYGETYMGEGPYVGMANKYLIMVTDKSSTYFDYLKSFTGLQSKFGQRWHFLKEGALYYGVASDLNNGALRHDTALHNDLIFNITINFIDGFRHYSYDLPVWIREGLGHWFERRNSPKWNTFDQDEAAPFKPSSKWKWKPYVRQLLNGKKWSKFSELIQWRHYGEINFIDHVMIWARIDFLMSFGKPKFKAFMFEIKGRWDQKLQRSDHSDLVGAVRDALRKAYGLSTINFDKRFRAWALENYPLR